MQHGNSLMHKNMVTVLNVIPSCCHFIYFSLSIFLQFLFKLLFVVHVWYYLSFFFTVKVLEKRHIIREKKAQYVSREKEVLSRLNHPFFVRLYFTFQDKEKLCILTTKTLFVFWYLSRSISSNRGFLIGIKEKMLLAILNRILSS